ncbi:MAG: hypothetical protein ACK4RV_11785 [Caulobacter sp.]
MRFAPRKVRITHIALDAGDRRFEEGDVVVLDDDTPASLAVVLGARLQAGTAELIEEGDAGASGGLPEVFQEALAAFLDDMPRRTYEIGRLLDLALECGPPAAAALLEALQASAEAGACMAERVQDVVALAQQNFAPAAAGDEADGAPEAASEASAEGVAAGAEVQTGMHPAEQGAGPDDPPPAPAGGGEPDPAPTATVPEDQASGTSEAADPVNPPEPADPSAKPKPVRKAGSKAKAD